MHLVRLRLINVRNHRRTELTPAPRLNVFVGQNAQGKSTLLEAVQVAAAGRSLRAAHDAELIRFGEEFARVVVAARRAGRDVEVDVALRRDEGDPTRAGKELRVNGVPVRRGDVFGQVLCIAIAPHDGEIATGGPQYRRRLLDLLLAQISPAYYYTAQRYARAMSHRNRLLRERRAAARDLGVWDEQVARLGAAITVRRREVVAALAAAAQATYGALCAGRESLAVTYAAAMPGRDEADIALGGLTAMERARAAELARGQTLVGPHRDDVHVTVDGYPLRQFGSRGQQMAAVLALRLAEREVMRDAAGDEPVLLLDDVLLALDQDRQARLLELTRDMQVALTATALAALPALPAGSAAYRVVEGTVEAQTAHRA